MPHTLAHVRVQWVANPLSGHVYFVLITRVDQVRDPALHRIELKTARSTAQRLAPLHLVVHMLSPQTRANIARIHQGTSEPRAPPATVSPIELRSIYSVHLMQLTEN
jgi:hypothetical protein